MVDVEVVMTELLKEKFRLMEEKASVRSRLHFAIAVGDHESTYAHAKVLSGITTRLTYLENEIRGTYVYLRQASQNLQTLL